MVVVSLPFWYYTYYGQPPPNGFYCNDETISLPYKSETVTFRTAFAVGISVPLIVIVLVELILLSVLRKSTNILIPSVG